MAGMAANPLIADTVVVFVDAIGMEYPVALPHHGHTNREVRAVAYRWACQEVASGKWRPAGELRYLRMGPST